MKPGIDHHLLAIATGIGTKVIPALPVESYAVGDAGMAAGVALLMAQEADRAADTLVRENAAIRALFVKAADHVGGDLGARLAEAGRGADASLRLSSLEAGNAGLKTLLITLHERVETSAEDWAVALNRAIWAALHRGAQDRLFVMPPV